MTNYTFLCTSDCHLGKNLYNIPELGEDLFVQYEKALELAKQLKVTYFIIVGDLFENNKPSATIISRVCKLHEKYSQFFEILGYVGDHDTEDSQGNSWLRICNVGTPTDKRLIGANYQIDQEQVANEIIEQLTKDTEFIFLHGQDPSLFPFCQEKKKLLLDWEMLFNDFPNLKGACLGDIHLNEHKYINGRFVGYCGSLGVTKKDEVDSKVIHYDGNKIKYLNLSLARPFKEFVINKDTKHSEVLSFVEQQEIKPVVILMSTRENSCYVNEFLKLKEKAFVIPDVIRETKDDNVCSVIRSEINLDGSVDKVIEQILTDNGTNTPSNLKLARELIKGIESGTIKTILNNFVNKK